MVRVTHSINTVTNPFYSHYATILDSGATHHIFKDSASATLGDRITDTTHNVLTPTGHTIKSMAKAYLQRPGLTRGAAEVFIFNDKDLPNYNLISVPQLCASGMTATFTKDGGTVTKSGLYEVDKGEAFAAVMFPKSSSDDSKARFYLAAMGSPTTSSLVTALEKGFVKFPGLKTSSVREQQHSEATARGHMDKTRCGMDSTLEPPPIASESRTLSVSVTKDKGSIYADMTGRFPVPSTRGAEYIMVMKCSDTGFIHVEPMKTRSARDMVAAMQDGVKFFSECGAPRGCTDRQ